MIYSIIHFIFITKKTIFSDMFYYILQHKNIYIEILFYKYYLIY